MINCSCSSCSNPRLTDVTDMQCWSRWFEHRREGPGKCIMVFINYKITQNRIIIIAILSTTIYKVLCVALWHFSSIAWPGSSQLNIFAVHSMAQMLNLVHVRCRERLGKQFNSFPDHVFMPIVHKPMVACFTQVSIYSASIIVLIQAHQFINVTKMGSQPIHAPAHLLQPRRRQLTFPATFICQSLNCERPIGTTNFVCKTKICQCCGVGWR